MRKREVRSGKTDLQQEEALPPGTLCYGGEVTIKVKIIATGIYVGVYVDDNNIVAEPRGFLNNYGINCNDGIDIRLVPSTEYDNTALFAPATKP